MRSRLSPTLVWKWESIPARARRSPIQAELVSTICPRSSSVPTATTSALIPVLGPSPCQPGTSRVPPAPMARGAGEGAGRRPRHGERRPRHGEAGTGYGGHGQPVLAEAGAAHRRRQLATAVGEPVEAPG